MIQRLARRSGWFELWARTILATAATVALITFLACADRKGPPASTAPSETNVYLAWNTHADTSVLGYRVYFGASLYPVESMSVVADTPNTETSFDWQRDLGSAPTVCFRLRAYNADGDGPFTDGICVVI